MLAIAASYASEDITQGAFTKGCEGGSQGTVIKALGAGISPVFFPSSSKFSSSTFPFRLSSVNPPASVVLRENFNVRMLQGDPFAGTHEEEMGREEQVEVEVGAEAEVGSAIGIRDTTVPHKTPVFVKLWYGSKFVSFPDT